MRIAFMSLAKSATAFVVCLGLIIHLAPAQAGGKDAALFVGGVLAGAIITQAVNNNVRNQYSPPPPQPYYNPSQPRYNPPQPRYNPPRRRRVVRRQPYSRAEARRIQVALNTLGYNAGAVDGAIGRGTKAAISAFQYDVDGRPTGRLTSNQKAVLFDRASVASRNTNQNNQNNQNNASNNNANQNNRNNQNNASNNNANQNNGNNQNNQTNTTQVNTTQNNQNNTTRINASLNQQPTKVVSSKQGRIRVQQALNALGYPAGNDNGRFTAQTREAIKAFQLDISRDATGLLSAEERQILFRDAADAVPRVTSAQGRIQVQQALNALGYPAGNENGRMTAQTRDAIKAFQLDISHQATGSLSAQEREILFRDAADLDNDSSG